MAFSFALAALIEGKVDAAWARWVRPWTLLAWAFLTGGDLAGAADDPQQREDRFYQRFRQRPATVAEAKEGKEADEQRRRDKPPQLHLQAAGPDQTVQRARRVDDHRPHRIGRSEEHTTALQPLLRISSALLC